MVELSRFSGARRRLRRRIANPVTFRLYVEEADDANKGSA
jgi:hypothetical protein